MATPIQPRRQPRRPVTMPALCRTQTGLRDNCRIEDISPQGCCVKTRRLLVRVGARVTVRPQGIEGQSGVVRWISGNLVGIEFDMPLYEPVVDHLTRMHAEGTKVAVTRS